MSASADTIGKIDPLDIPNLNEQGLFDYLHKELGIPMGRNAIKVAVMSRQIKPTRISGKNLFSRSDGLNWITAQRNKSENV